MSRTLQALYNLAVRQSHTPGATDWAELRDAARLDLADEINNMVPRHPDGTVVDATPAALTGAMSAAGTNGIARVNTVDLGGGVSGVVVDIPGGVNNLAPPPPPPPADPQRAAMLARIEGMSEADRKAFFGDLVEKYGTRR